MFIVGSYMAVGGAYLSFQLSGALPFFRLYKESIVKDALSGFANLEGRADVVADAAFKRLGSRLATSDCDDRSQDAEWAEDEGQAYYEAMVGLRQATINLGCGAIPFTRTTPCEDHLRLQVSRNPHAARQSETL